MLSTIDGNCIGIAEVKMKCNTAWLFLLLIIALFGFAGCASRGASHFSQPLNTNLSDYKSMTVSVTSNVANTDALVMQIEGAILSGLRNQGKYSRVSSGNVTDTELKTTVIITKIRDVDTSDRVMWGALAGQGKIYADVELSELKSGKVLAKGSVEGKTSGGSIFAGTTPQAAARVAEEVLKFISQ